MNDQFFGDMTDVANLLAARESKRLVPPPMETAPVEFVPPIPEVPVSMAVPMPSAPRP